MYLFAFLRFLRFETLHEDKEVQENYHEEKARGVINHARAWWHKYGEKRTKYSLEKRDHVKKKNMYFTHRDMSRIYGYLEDCQFIVK